MTPVPAGPIVIDWPGPTLTLIVSSSAPVRFAPVDVVAPTFVWTESVSVAWPWTRPSRLNPPSRPMLSPVTVACTFVVVSVENVVLPANSKVFWPPAPAKTPLNGCTPEPIRRLSLPAPPLMSIAGPVAVNAGSRLSTTNVLPPAPPSRINWADGSAKVQGANPPSHCCRSSAARPDRRSVVRRICCAAGDRGRVERPVGRARRVGDRRDAAVGDALADVPSCQPGSSSRRTAPRPGRCPGRTSRSRRRCSACWRHPLLPS